MALFAPRGSGRAGWPGTRTRPGAPRAPREVFDAGVPILGICYGMQTLSAQLGGATEAADQREFGHAAVEQVAQDAFLEGLNDLPGAVPRLAVWMRRGQPLTMDTQGHPTPTAPAALGKPLWGQR